jgi:copper transport protein
MGAAVPGHLVRAMRRSVGIEIVAAILVLAVTAVDPTRRGAQAMTLHILTAAGASVPARAVTATLSSAQVAALHLTLRRLTPDGSQWATRAPVVPLPGVWTLTLDVALGPADAYATSASYRVW